MRSNRVALTLVRALLIMGASLSRADEVIEGGVSLSAPSPESVVKDMSDFMAAKKDVRFKVYETMETSGGGDAVIQNSNTLEFWLKRPDKVRAVLLGDTLNRDALYENGELVIHDKNLEVFMVKKNLPGAVDGFLNHMAEKEGMVIPVSDLLTSDIQQAIMRNVVSSDFIGDGMVRDEKCHHLFFRQDDIDWQIWISADPDMPVPMKMLIVYRKSPHAPRYTAYFEGWSFAPIADSVFVMKRPEGVEVIEFMSDIAKKAAPATTRED